MTRASFILSMIAALLFAPCVSGAPRATYDEAMLQARRIRVMKLSRDWKDKTLSLELRDGSRERGKLQSVFDGKFVLVGAADRRKEVPVDDVVSVVIHPGVSDRLLGALAGVMTGGLTYGVMNLGADARPSVSLGGAIAGFLAGAVAGVRFASRETVIPLDAVDATSGAAAP
ncbi:hypothetical protein FJZ36_18220 [Candidatus Poribacteria bacterium]|nr:hypothetical protein [Candidatus Poribacteria bacterium]